MWDGVFGLQEDVSQWWFERQGPDDPWLRGVRYNIRGSVILLAGSPVRR
jgi:hypothetical protein